MTKPIILVDGSSYLFRAFYALPPLTTKTGHPTGAMLGVLNMLDRLLQEYDPEYIGVIFDAKGKTFRHHLYEAYKAHRRAMPEDLKQQVEPLHELVKALGLPLVMIEGVEADDVIGTLALAASREGQTVLISTGDKDIAQLVNPRVSLIDTMKGAYSDEAGVKAKFGVRPDQIIDYLALVGDASDNIPGVSKVGPKTALKWLEEYGSLDNLLAHADEISGKVGENLRADRETALLSRQLVTIQCDVPLPVTWQSLIRRPVDPSVLLPLLKAWEFKSWIKKYETTPEEEVSSPLSTLPAQYECITNEADWAKWKQKLETAPLISIDTETTSLDEMQAKLVGISFTTGDQTSAYLPLGHDLLSAPEQLPFEKTLSDIKPILENPSIGKVGQNLKYDIKVLMRYGIEMKGITFDTMLASYILEAGQTRHDLDALSERHLGRKTITYESVAGKGAKAITFDQVPLSAAAPYAAEDADLAWQLYLFFQNKFREIPSLETVFQEVEIPMIDVLVAMERRGVLVNQSLLQAQSQEIAHELLKLEEKIYHEAGMSFNVASPKQLQEVLFEKMQIPVTRKTPGGQPSTAEDVLQELAEQYVLPALILEYRHLNKLKSTYTDRLPEQINPDTGRVHTHYQQAVAATGRLASSDPNLQNIPIRTEQGRRIRQAFIAPKGYRILAADYSQVELRIMAHLSQDEGLLSAFKEGKDVHAATASELFDIPLNLVTTEHRRHAKAINFGLIYGMSAFGLAKQLGISREDAQKYMNVYFERYPGVARFMESTRAQAAEQGYVETLFGRRLYLAEIRSKEVMRRRAAERAAINAPMQGTAADIIKRAMITLHGEFLNSDRVHMILQVHDELIFEVREDSLDYAEPIIRRHMENAASLAVPLVVGIGVGSNWDEAH